MAQWFCVLLVMSNITIRMIFCFGMVECHDLRYRKKLEIALREMILTIFSDICKHLAQVFLSFAAVVSPTLNEAKLHCWHQYITWKHHPH